MSYRIALVSVSLLLALIGAFWLHLQPTSPPIASSMSQQDIEPDLSSTKGYYDFALSGLGEINIEQVQHQVNQQAQRHTELSLSAELFDLYLQYKAALAELPPLPTGQIHALDLEQMHLSIRQLQQQFFTTQQITLLFNDENLLRELAIEKAWAAQSRLDSEQQRYIVADKLAQMPEYIKQAEKNAILVSDLNQVDSLDPPQRYTTRVELVGEQGALRLAELDQQRATFQQKLTDYLAKRDQLLNQALNQNIEQPLSELRSQYFEAKQLRRVEALERLHDQGVSVNTQG
ncbi:lipase secretion chaperone [Vibrio sp. JPW-9-11-11]|uniref:lipase secretion chaperone n=1 Tax=Vibrio sp. JPW-9-11-11 TaxID=1416532 RepID=UPI0020CCC3C9|nr:lipase secretion chaperone [Vibrio sp. JPW-9-11-11]